MEIKGAQNDENDCDPRLCTKIISWIVFILSTIIAIIGLIYIIKELKAGAKEDLA